MTHSDTRNLRDDDIDRLGKALLSLCRELWVVKDRLCILEAALADKGVIASDLIDAYEPDEELQQRLADERAALVNSVLDALETTAPAPAGNPPRQ